MNNLSGQKSIKFWGGILESQKDILKLTDLYKTLKLLSCLFVVILSKFNSRIEISSSWQPMANMLLSSSCYQAVLRLVAVVRQPSGICQAAGRQLAGSCQAVVRQLSGSHQAVDEKINQWFQGTPEKRFLVNRGWGRGQTVISLQGTKGDIPRLH